MSDYRFMTCVIDPWALNLPGYTTGFVDGFGTVDDYGTLVYWPFASVVVFYAQVH